MKKLSFAVLLLCLSLGQTLLAQSSPAPAPQTQTAVDPEKEKMIRQMMELTQTSRMTDQMMAETIASLKDSIEGLPPDFWTRFQSKLDRRDLENRMVAIYDRHFTKQDLQGVLDFYKTPAGRKLISEMPTLLNEAMAAGQQWSHKVGQEVVQELDAEGYLKKASPSPAASPSAKPTGKPSP